MSRLTATGPIRRPLPRRTTPLFTAGLTLSLAARLRLDRLLRRRHPGIVTARPQPPLQLRHLQTQRVHCRPQLSVLGVSRRQHVPQPGVRTTKLLNQLHSGHVRHKSRSSPSTPSNQAPPLGVSPPTSPSTRNPQVTPHP